jgi:hypothetical protein
MIPLLNTLEKFYYVLDKGFMYKDELTQTINY